VCVSSAVVDVFPWPILSEFVSLPLRDYVSSLWFSLTWGIEMVRVLYAPAEGKMCHICYCLHIFSIFFWIHRDRTISMILGSYFIIPKTPWPSDNVRLDWYTFRDIKWNPLCWYRIFVLDCKDLIVILLDVWSSLSGDIYQTALLLELNCGQCSVHDTFVIIVE